MILGRVGSKPREFLLREILPMGFGPEDLGESGPSGKAGGDFVERGDAPSGKCNH